MSPHNLNIQTFPLRGAQLIEASAGTGKTWTIAALYVRLVLGHGDSVAPATGLVPPAILVVTFTDAATQELRDRIRSRLNETARFFRGTLVGQPDEFLEEIRASFRDEKDWSRCARRLEIAAEWMDEAAVSTIHSWCYKMLRQHAFDSGSLFTLELDTDTGPIFSEIVRDYWRTYLAQQSLNAVKEFKKIWGNPGDLQKQIEALAPNLELALAADEDVIHDFAADADLKWSACEKHKQHWQKENLIDDLENILTQANEKAWVNRNKIQERSYKKWINAFREWVDQPNQLLPNLGNRKSSVWTRLTPSGFMDAWNGKGGETPQNMRPFEAFEKLITDLDSIEENSSVSLEKMVVHATTWTVRRFDEYLRRNARLGYNELLTRFDEALETNSEWDNKSNEAQRLIKRIRLDFPVALIDEFQDTDPVQYRIFRSIYLDNLPSNAADDAETALVMIGDPKQAIYSFRGADIYTYLDARRACGDNLHTLDTNYRSSKSALKAVNALFSRKEESDQGAFLFKKEDENPVPFLPVKPNTSSRFLLALPGCNPDLARALTLHHLIEGADSGGHFNKNNYTYWSALFCANRIVELLNAGASSPPLIGFSHDGKTLIRGVQPSDIAVLVNNGFEAETVRNALHQRSVRSVYLSEKEEVYDTDEAKDLCFVLEACAAPNNLRLLKTALATPLIETCLAELDEINRDGNLLEVYQNQFITYQQLWRKRGVLPLIRRVLHDFNVPARLLNDRSRLNGERTLTNTLHIAELLQQASNLLEGEPALIRYLKERIEGEGGEPNQESRKLRLESDEQLVKVVTIHKSKGLEYPLVFVPFTSNTRLQKIDEKTKSPLRFHQEDGTPNIEFDRNNLENIARADEERLGEDMRKLYVALTRARYATWVGLGKTAHLNRSAIGSLLWGLDTATPNMDEIPEFDSSIEPEHLLRVHIEPYAISYPKYPVPFAPHHSDGGEKPLFWRKPTRDLHENWWVASYTAIAKYDLPLVAQTVTQSNDAQRAAAPLAAENAQFDEDYWIATQELAQPATKVATQLADFNDTPQLFPGGTGVGNFLHNLFEQMTHRGFDKVANDPSIIATLVNQACADTEWEAFIPGLIEWLKALITTPLIDGVALCDLTRTTAKAEMEFWLSVNHVNLATLDATIRKKTLANAPRPIIKSGQMNGMLKGFIDLLFEHEGRYYVLDYKSNRVGPEVDDYTTERMQEMILKSRYDLQYVLYLTALHRLLKTRLPNYDYDTHVGGAIYFFLRGIYNPSRGVHFEKPPKSLINDLDALFLASNQRGDHESV